MGWYLSIVLIFMFAWSDKSSLNNWIYLVASGLFAIAGSITTGLYGIKKSTKD